MASETPYSVKDKHGLYGIYNSEGGLLAAFTNEDEARYALDIANNAYAAASSAAADEVGRLRRVAQKFIDDVDALRERSNREKRVLGGQRCTIVLIDDACEGIEAIRSALATDASGAMKHKESQ